MKKLALAVSVLAVSAVSATAADLPVKPYTKATPMMAAAAYDWSGFYIGGHVGYGWETAGPNATPGGSWVGDPDWPNVSTAAGHRINANGAFGGAQAGYNYQLSNILLGIEADIAYFGLRKSFNSGTINGIIDTTGFFSVNSEVKTDWLITLRPRIGITTGNWLLYATGGLALAQARFDQTIFFLNPLVDFLPHTPGSGGANAGSIGSTRVGWTMGAGAEWAVDRQWSVKAEYLHVDLGHQSFNSGYLDLDGNTFSVTHNLSLNIDTVKLGLNYRFH